MCVQGSVITWRWWRTAKASRKTSLVSYASSCRTCTRSRASAPSWTTCCRTRAVPASRNCSTFWNRTERNLASTASERRSPPWKKSSLSELRFLYPSYYTSRSVYRGKKLVWSLWNIYQRCTHVDKEEQTGRPLLDLDRGIFDGFLNLARWGIFPQFGSYLWKKRTDRISLDKELPIIFWKSFGTAFRIRTPDTDLGSRVDSPW